MRLAKRFLVAPLVALAVLAPNTSLTQAKSQVQASPAAVIVGPGQILANSKGLALYTFALDKPNVSNCSGACAKFWPPLTVPASAKVPATMSGIAGKFGEIMRTDGTEQVTYDKAPLYTFLEDKDSGDLYGEGLYASGGYWWAVVVSRSAMPGSSS